MATRDHGPRGDKATFLHRGLSFTRHTERDDYHGPPWEDDGRGVVTDWLYYPDDPNLRKLGSEQRDGTARYFDQAATVAKAEAESWGDPNDPTIPADRLSTAERAAEAEFQFLNGWCADDWEYVGVVVTLADSTITRSLWGIESNAAGYIEEVGRELADQIIDEAGDELEAEINRLNQLRATVSAATRITEEGATDGN